MAYPTTSTLRAAIDATVATPVSRLFLWIDGDSAPAVDFTYLLAGWTVDRTPDDTPDLVSRMAGSIAAKATLTLGWLGPVLPDGAGALFESRDLLPFVGGLSQFANGDYGIGVKVQLQAGFRTTAGVETLPIFNGRIESVSTDDGATLQVTCLDFFQDLLGQVSLPVAAAHGDSPGIPVYTCIEHLLRAGGYYRTPPALAGAVLSVPAILPEVGDVAAPLWCQAGAWDGFSRHITDVTGSKYLATTTYNPGQPDVTWAYEGWVRVASAWADVPLVQFGVDAGNFGGFVLYAGTSGQIGLRGLQGAPGFSSTTGIYPRDSAWHYLYVEWTTRIPGGAGTPSIDWFVRIDGTSYTGNSTAPLTINDADNGSTVVHLTGHLREGVSMRKAPAASFVRTLRNTWTPNYDTDVRGDSPLIDAVPRGTTGTAKDLIRQIAVAFSDLYRWREDGVWRYETRTSWVQRRAAAAVLDVDHTQKLLSAGYSYEAASRLRSVSVDYTLVTVTRSTAAAPAWSATDVIIAAPGWQDINIETPSTILGIPPAVRSDSPQAAAVTYQTVWDYAVGDASAQIIQGVRVWVLPTATGIRVRVFNGNRSRVAFWSPNTGQPALQVQGFVVAGVDAPRTYTMAGSPRSREDLVLDSSPWRQDYTTAQQIADQIAVDASRPAVVMDQIRTTPDPSLTVDDVIRVRAPQIMANLVPVQVIGKNDTDTESTLTVRACYPPNGWVLGIPGRSELGSTAVLMV